MAGRESSPERWSRLNDIKALADDCVHCGFCLPTCPTYLLWGHEADSPRGRIYLLKAELEGRAAITETFRRHFDTCLGCMACVTACPSGVQYDRLIETIRPRIEHRGTRAVGDRLFRQLVFWLFPRPQRLRWVTAPLGLYQRSGLQWVARASGLINLLPKRLQALERLAPRVSFSSSVPPLPPVVPAAGSGHSSPGLPRRRVGMLLGCVQRVFFPEVNAATARVLAAEGCEVHIPPAQGCCGALMLHAGREEEAADAARRLIDAFESARPDAPSPPSLDKIVVNAAGCGSAMKQYGELLGDDPSYATRARAFAAKCVDVSEVLAELEPRATRHPLPLRVAYHDACHLQHAQGIRQQPRAILKSIPDLQLSEIAEGDICCGSAGLYNLLEPEAAAALGARKLKQILDTNAEVVVSANPGCLLQISSELNRPGGTGRTGQSRPLRAMHLVQLLDASMRGVTGRPARDQD